MVALPFASLVDDMYSRLSIPLSCCSMTEVTVSVSVLAEAPE